MFHRFTQFAIHAMPRAKTGINVNCPICGTPLYRQAHNVRSNTKLYCSVECAGVGRSGEGNPFWGKKHPPELVARIAAKIRANPGKGTGPKKGVFKHTPEARAKMSAALRERWRTKRADMLAYCHSGLNKPHDGIHGGEPRHHFIFTKEQKAEWIGEECAYCGTKDDLVLDHIIPIICGGTNIRSNAQTLCQPCNRWKMVYVDRPLYLAVLGRERGSVP